MTEKTKIVCSTMVNNGWIQYSCNNVGRVKRDGKHYCGIHDPVAQEERRQKRQAVRDAVGIQRRRIVIGQRNADARATVLEFLERMGRDPWLAETLSALVGIMNSQERATQFIELLNEKAREWVQEKP